MSIQLSICFSHSVIPFQTRQRYVRCDQVRKVYTKNILKKKRVNFSTRRGNHPIQLSLRNGEQSRDPEYTSSLQLTKAKIPMILTYCRLIAVPLLCVVGLLPTLKTKTYLAAVIFAVASITDFFDGFLARRWGVVSALGTFLDPVADKIMVAVALTLISARLSYPLIVLSSAIILAREIFVSALREWMAILGKSADVQVSIWGKIKTTMQMIAVTTLLFTSGTETILLTFGTIALVVSAVLTIFSAAEYIANAAKAIKQE